MEGLDLAPGMLSVRDGLTFRAVQRRNRTLRDIPVIALTAFPTRRADFDCLHKPLRFESLTERIRTVVPAAAP